MSDTLPPVQITFVPEGVDAVKKAFKTIETATRQHYIQTAKYAIKAASDTQRAYDKLYSNLDRQANNQKDKAITIQSDLVAKQKALNDKLLAQEKALTQKLLSEYKTRGTGFKESMGKLGRAGISSGSGARIGGGANRNQVAGALGTIFGIGGGAGVLGRTAQGASAGFGVAGVAGGAIGGAAALAAATIQKAFDTLISGITSGAEAFFGAITQLGGGFDVSDAIAKVHKNNRSAAAISAGTQFLSADQRITSGQALNMANSAVKGTEFDQATGLAALAAWQAKTGDTKSFAANAQFLTAGASTFGGGDLVGFTNQLANTKTQFSSLSDKDLVRVALGQMQQGQKGSVEFKDQASLATITAAAGNQTGDIAKNILFQTGLAQLAAPGAGGSVDEAATQIRSYNTGIGRLARAKAGSKDAAARANLGLQTDQYGKITNYQDTLKKITLMNPSEVPQAIAGEVRGSTFIQSLRNKITGTTKEERSESYDKLIKEFTDVTISMDDFNKATKETSETIDYQLKAAFNELKQLIGDQVAPDIEKFTKSFKENQPLIESTIKTVITYFELLGQAVSDFVTEYLLPYMIKGNQKALDTETNVLAENKNTLQHKRNIQGGDYYKNATPEYRRTIDLQVAQFEEKVRKSESRVKYLTENALNLDEANRRSHLTPDEKKAESEKKANEEGNLKLQDSIDKMSPEQKDKIRKQIIADDNRIGPASVDQQKLHESLLTIAKALDTDKNKKYSQEELDAITAAIKAGFDKEPVTSPPNGG